MSPTKARSMRCDGGLARTADIVTSAPTSNVRLGVALPDVATARTPRPATTSPATVRRARFPEPRRPRAVTDRDGSRAARSALRDPGPQRTYGAVGDCGVDNDDGAAGCSGGGAGAPSGGAPVEPGAGGAIGTTAVTPSSVDGAASGTAGDVSNGAASGPGDGGADGGNEGGGGGGAGVGVHAADAGTGARRRNRRRTIHRSRPVGGLR